MPKRFQDQKKTDITVLTSWTSVQVYFKSALSRLCTCASSDDSHCFIANRNNNTSINLPNLKFKFLKP